LEWHWQVHADYVRAVLDASDAEIAKRQSWRWPAEDLGRGKGTIKLEGKLPLGEALRVLSLFKPDYRWPDV
jgi:hypothetical protein